MADKQYSGMTYLHGQWRYFVDKREDNGKFTAFMSSSDPIMGGAKTEVTGIGDWDTFEQAQNSLDGFALKRGFEKECSTSSKNPEMEQQTFGFEPDKSSETVPPSNDTHEVEQESDVPEQSSPFADENPDSQDDYENDAEEPDDTEEKAKPLPDGPDLSLRLPEFDSLFAAADASLRDLARAMKTKLIESGELTIKVVINNYGGRMKPGPKKCKVDCAAKPAKVSTSIRFPDDLEITVEQDGRVIIPEGRDQQLSFEETKDGGTVTVDGQTGLAEHYEDSGEDNPDGDNTPPENPEEAPQDAQEDDSGDSDFGGDPNAQEDRPPYIDREDVEQGDDEE